MPVRALRRADQAKHTPPLTTKWRTALRFVAPYALGPITIPFGMRIPVREAKVPFDADYHETKEGFALVYDLGRVAIEWNMVEHWFTCMIWEMLGDYSTGMAVTGGMGNQSKADVVLKLARERIRNAEVLDRVEFACKTFNTLRENRNMLVHSHSIFQPEQPGGKPIWARATSGRGTGAHAWTEADIADLEVLIAQICGLGLFVTDLIWFLHPRNRRRRRLAGAPPATLPDKFPPPRILTQSRAEEPAHGKTARSSRKRRRAD